VKLNVPWNCSLAAPWQPELQALPAIKLFLGFIKKNNFIPFGVYRIILVVVFFLFVIMYAGLRER
jgi:undecaprenyl pyrophosphate phosphatase UppP